MAQGLGFKNGPPVTTGCWKEPTEGTAPSPSTLLPQHKVPNLFSLPAADSLPVSQKRGPSHLTCSCQSASLEEVSSPGQLGASSRGRRCLIAAPTEQQDAPSPLRFGRLPPPRAPRERKPRSQSAQRLWRCRKQRQTINLSCARRQMEREDTVREIQSER